MPRRWRPDPRGTRAKSLLLALPALPASAATARLKEQSRSKSSCSPKQSGLRSVHGASRARTGDLLAASQTLSQLSYGPLGCDSVAAPRAAKRGSDPETQTLGLASNVPPESHR